MGRETLIEGVRIAADALRANKVRAGLTVLGVAIGVAVVVTVAALITGIRSSVMEGFEAAGPRNFIVLRFDMTDVRLVGPGHGPTWWEMPKITESEAMRIARLPAVREAIIDFDFSSTISYEGRRVSGVQSSADSEPWPAYTIGDFVAGRNFLPSEVRQTRSVVVISRPLAEELFGPLDPVGRRVRVGAGRSTNELFTVVGVFDVGEQIFADAVRHFAIFPYTTALTRLKVSDEFLGVLVVPRDEVSSRAAMDQVIGAMRSMRALGPKEANNFAVLPSQRLIELFDQLTGVFFLVMLALSSVGLMVGGVGVIGIMMISVTERTREIGIRKAVGATRREILWQFLVEAGVLTLLGGALGLVLGAGSAESVAAYTPIPASIPLWSIFAALAMALLTGMLFGLLPAVRASRLDPVAALGYE
ncbi:MAG: ABC transporter permease [Gemmatimonadetes bacterium]|nr:ABC transporter permease [Gemmatimonadota bacterium]NIR77517.1 ABC transporter permease [Gemmatimonadota bacterium]NIV60282.1 FtsX-like permease family protein [Gemmatimonadota bacterium]NIV81785.1 FtsX-like permease family protein [Gemmatimonadota bacterium]NIW62945.1 FtsX-like permease family protein [Gemmatimonadota bacterium]